MSNGFASPLPEKLSASQVLVGVSPLRILGFSGTFDVAFYSESNPDLANLRPNLLDHYHQHGWREGRKPNPFFDPHWYLSQNKDVIGDPLLHYVTLGERDGRKPIAWFDPVWYKKTYTVADDTLALAHYLANRHQVPLRPIPEFDPEFYLRTYPDVAKAGLDPLEHYMIQGFREARQPFDGFDPIYYRQKYLRQFPDRNPLLHYLAHREFPDIHPASPGTETSVFAEIRKRTQPGPMFEKSVPLPENVIRRARLLAYYLPQFHTIPENDAWWGEGFTEWTNLPRGVPRFVDHYQPRTPRDLGHYTLDDPEVLRRQAQMAHGAGIEGFVFYFYWFNGQRLLERPLELLLENSEIDIGFCLMWANENWSRRWDGSENDILIAQHYRPEDDDALVDCFARYMRDPRYIRINDRPLLMVYRPGTIPDAEKAFGRWRALFRSRHGLDPLLVMGQAFGDENPDIFGLDGAIEFPPHKIVSSCQLTNDNLELLDPEFSGQVYDYSDVVDASLDQPPAPFPLIRTAAPSWDNDARRQGKGLIFQGSTPALYERWLRGLIDQARIKPFFGEPIVCINAWNEWAEGAYLEPDQHFGSAYLNATARACSTTAATQTHLRILLIGHDAFPAGAQRLLLETGRSLKRQHGADIRFVLLGDGALLEQYRAIAPTDLLEAGTRSTSTMLERLYRDGYQHAILNSAASSALSMDLANAKIPFVFLIHELQELLKDKNLTTVFSEACKQSFTNVVPARSVARQLGLSADPKLKIAPQGLYNTVFFKGLARRSYRRDIGVGEHESVLIGAGHADLRKGFDIFLQLWQRSDECTHFVWLGDIAPALRHTLSNEIDSALASRRVHLPGQVTDMAGWLSAADAFVLTSREDPYPSVVLEALSTGLPCILFDRTGGIPDLMRDLMKTNADIGAVVPAGDLAAMEQNSLSLAAKSHELGIKHRSSTARRMARQFGFSDYVCKLLSLTLSGLPLVSVVVPSHNYARYMRARLASIFDQTSPVLEIIVLDDASSDDSVEVAQATARDWGREIECVENRVPSGSVFRQWAKGIHRAKGDWIWIAEADDLSEPDFLERLIDAIGSDPHVVMAFSDSRTIDAEGRSIASSYRSYYAGSAGNLLENDNRFCGIDFLKGCLSERNLVLNVSSAIFRRRPLIAALKTCRADLEDLQVAGDWRLYIELLLQPNVQVAYVASPLNVHRRHESSATHVMDRRGHVEEIAFLHEILAQRLCLPQTKQDSQKRYRLALEQQFALPPKEVQMLFPTHEA